ncbi:methyl-accepting chemotaxis protein [Massilia atriviolacea]|uniref:methyl-accepting chemotaxis protein n=1 Tax=Massilia atriviolacea TaxID=2495579 RepID=UPI0027D95CF2|nr:methyl-accepting chemotaxis protein [Massilia atriviolacea]
MISAIFIAFILFVAHTMSSAIEKRANAAVNTQAEGVGNVIETFNRTQLANIGKFSKVFASLLPGKFSVDSTRSVQTGAVTVPAMQHDGVDLNLNFSAVDRFSEMSGGNATIFIRHGEDFVRVATSVKKADGERAVGTSLGKTHPAFEKIMQGQTYRGMAVLFGKPHVTEYVPVLDAGARVIGILYVGVDISQDIDALKSLIKSLKVGASGYFFVLNAKEGEQLGDYVVHPALEGQKALAQRDTGGRAFIGEILRTGKGSMHVVPAGAKGQPEPERILVYSTNKDWNWTIVGVAFADEVTHEVSSMRLTLFVVGGVALLGFAAALFFIVRKIVSTPLGLATAAAARLAQGDLTVRLHASAQDEIGQLMEAMNGISAGLATVVTSIRQGTGEVATASSEIASGNQELSSRTEQQAGSLEETASSMEELTVTVRQNADNARQANQLALSASAIAQKGGKVVAQVVSTMEAIDASSKKIADIISVIDGIAFQTNILALNAAVEAARAGEQGRGFAVVATEVRSLAQRSAQAAREIKALIDDSAAKVATGSELVTSAGRTMDEVVGSVRKVNDIMGDIVAASDEQSAGIGEVNQAVASMDQATQQNAALVEEAAAAAQAMQEMAAELERSVRIFKLG